MKTMLSVLAVLMFATSIAFAGAPAPVDSTVDANLEVSLGDLFGEVPSWMTERGGRTCPFSAGPDCRYDWQCGPGMVCDHSDGIGCGVCRRGV